MTWQCPECERTRPCPMHNADLFRPGAITTEPPPPLSSLNDGRPTWLVVETETQADALRPLVSPNVHVSSISAAITGRRFDRIVCLASITSSDAKQQAMRLYWYQTRALTRLSPEGALVLVGAPPP